MAKNKKLQEVNKVNVVTLAFGWILIFMVMSITFLSQNYHFVWLLVLYALLLVGVFVLMLIKKSIIYKTLFYSLLLALAIGGLGTLIIVLSFSQGFNNLTY
jgi:ABC-type Na+ efflux pump permease subunit